MSSVSLVMLVCHSFVHQSVTFVSSVSLSLLSVVLLVYLMLNYG